MRLHVYLYNIIVGFIKHNPKLEDFLFYSDFFFLIVIFSKNLESSCWRIFMDLGRIYGFFLSLWADLVKRSFSVHPFSRIKFFGSVQIRIWFLRWMFNRVPSLKNCEMWRIYILCQESYSFFFVFSIRICDNNKFKLFYRAGLRLVTFDNWNETNGPPYTFFLWTTFNIHTKKWHNPLDEELHGMYVNFQIFKSNLIHIR